MNTIRSLLLPFSCLALLGGCAYTDTPCILPGPIQLSTCHYFLTITKKVSKEDGSYEVRGQVAKAAVENNRNQLGWFEGGELDYHFFNFPLCLDRSVAAKVEVNQDYWFKIVEGTDCLTEYTPPDKTLEKYKTTTPWESPTAK
jgi:hypothetical protein